MKCFTKFHDFAPQIKKIPRPSPPAQHLVGLAYFAKVPGKKILQSDILASMGIQVSLDSPVPGIKRTSTRVSSG